MDGAIWTEPDASRFTDNKPPRGGIARLLILLALLAAPSAARAQTVDDGSDATIAKADTRIVLELIARNLKNASEAKVTELRRSKGSIVCGSVNVKGRQGLYLGERGFIIDLSKASFGRVPEGPELLNPRDAGFEDKERIRQLYFEMCLD